MEPFFYAPLVYFKHTFVSNILLKLCNKMFENLEELNFIF